MAAAGGEVEAAAAVAEEDDEGNGASRCVSLRALAEASRASSGEQAVTGAGGAGVYAVARAELARSRATLSRMAHTACQVCEGAEATPPLLQPHDHPLTRLPPPLSDAPHALANRHARVWPIHCLHFRVTCIIRAVASSAWCTDTPFTSSTRSPSRSFESAARLPSRITET